MAKVLFNIFYSTMPRSNPFRQKCQSALTAMNINGLKWLSA